MRRSVGVFIASLIAFACGKPYAEPNRPPGAVLIPVTLEANAPSVPMAAESSVRVHVYDLGRHCPAGDPGAESYLGVITLRNATDSRMISVASGHRVYVSFRLQSKSRGGVRNSCDRSGWLVPIDDGRYHVKYTLADAERCFVEVHEENSRRTTLLSPRCP